MKTCEQCSGPFVPNKPKQRFCSPDCARRWSGRQRDFNGPRNPRYNGGFSEADGRTIVCTRNGRYVFWYRIVMEDVLGRELTPDEVVHHINGDKTDDRPENLQVLTRAEHLAVHRDEVSAARKHKRGTHCRRGHPFSGDNLYVKPDGRRECKTCMRLRRMAVAA